MPLDMDKLGHVVIGLSRCADKVVLSIQDDGSGFPEKLDNKEGMGLRIMNYRANMIGAAMDIQKHQAAERSWFVRYP